MTTIQQGPHDQIALENNVARLVLESPPYWGRRRYGNDPNELGQEDLYAYLERLVDHGREVRRILDRGIWALNIGDTAAGSGGSGGDYVKGSKKAALKYRQASPRVKIVDPGTLEGWRMLELPPGGWCNVPGRLEDALVADGWRVRSRITWDKGRRRPEDLKHVKRPGESSETILLLSPDPTNVYRFRPDMLEELGDVWHFAPSGKSTRDSDVEHAAPFPDELVSRLVRVFTIPGDLVVDCFAGSGTTGRVAQDLGRRSAMFDLYAEPLPVSAPSLRVEDPEVVAILCTRGGKGPTEADLEVVAEFAEALKNGRGRMESRSALDRATIARRAEG